MSPRASSRRQLLRHGAAACCMAVQCVRAQPAPVKLRMLLNTGYSGPQAWLLLAQANGHLARAGIELDLTIGAGAYTAALRMIDGNYDLAYGDVNSLIEEVAHRPSTAPAGVYMLFNASPSAVTVRANGPLRNPRDLQGLVRAVNRGLADTVRDPPPPSSAWSDTLQEATAPSTLPNSRALWASKSRTPRGHASASATWTTHACPG